MIKICFFIENISGGGAEKVLLNLVNNMDQSRFDITVATLWPFDAGKYLKAGIHARSVFSAQNRITNTLMRLETSLGLIYPLHLRGKYDIEAAYLECGATKIMAASTNKRAKKLAWVHCDLMKAMSDPAAFAAKTAAQYRKFDRVVCVSQTVQQSVRTLFGDDIPADILYNTVDDAEILRKSLEPTEKSNGKFTILSVGRLMRQKNFPRLLRAVQKLRADGFDFELHILGEGEDRPMLEQTIAQNHLEDTVKLLGFRPNPYPHIKAADLLVCSSIYEGFSTFITEGLILGRPIVTTDCSGMRELLGDSEFGLITENDDDKLNEGMKKMLADPALRSHYTAMSAARGKDFSAAKLTAQTEKYLEDLLAE